VEVKSVENLKPDEIEKVDVLKGETGLKLYGENGKNGVVLITTKTAGNITKTDDNKVTGFGTQIRPTATFKSANNNGVGFDFGSFSEVDPTGPPLYVIDGVEIKSVENLKPEEIESISVLKGKSATTLYGEKGKNGVILITTKKSAEKAAVKVARNPIVIVDGKEFDGEIKDIPVDEIASVSVLKNENASPFNYSERAKDGTIVINTKTKYNSEKTEVKLDQQTILDLRKKIAWTIKYPVVAQENNQQGVVEVWAFIAKDGTISRITDKKPDGKFINVDEVVVTSYKREKTVTSEKSNDLALLVKESKRVIEQLSPLNIPELAGEMVCFRIKFVLE
jgi:TonB-dependent SusC/RagA subfamily outer membrane receptor